MRSHLLERLCDRLAAEDPTFCAHELHLWPRSDLDLARSLGLLCESAMIGTCDSCMSTSPRWRVEDKRIAMLLAEKLELSGKVQSLVNRVWRLGRRHVAGCFSDFFLAAIEPDSLAPTVEQIHRKCGMNPGVLLLPFPAALDTRSDTLLRILDLSKVARIERGPFWVDLDYIEKQFIDHRLPPAAKRHDARLRAHRLGILKAYMEAKRLEDRGALARHLGVSKSALYGMVRGESVRYSEETLTAVLEKIGCSRPKWDLTAQPASPA